MAGYLQIPDETGKVMSKTQKRDSDRVSFRKNQASNLEFSKK